MRYWTITLLAFVLFAACVFLFCDKLTELLDAGTCASGNQPFVIANECPEGTETDGLLIGASVFGMLFAGVLAVFRGSRPGTTSGPHAGRLALSGWAFFFTASGTVSLAHAFTSDVVGSDGKTGGIIVGVTFLFMGLPVLAGFAAARLGLFSRAFGRLLPRPNATEPDAAGQQPTGWKSARDPEASASWSAPPAAARPAGSGGDTIGQLERLQRLREAGALSEAEFEQQKAELLAR